MFPTAGQTAGLNGLKFWTLMGSLGVTLAKKSGFFFLNFDFFFSNIFSRATRRALLLVFYIFYIFYIFYLSIALSFSTFMACIFFLMASILYL